MPSANTPRFYGQTESNSSRSADDLWGMNQFNSTFQVALCLFMRDPRIGSISVAVDNDKFVNSEQHWSMSDVLGVAEDEAYYEFEDWLRAY